MIIFSLFSSQELALRHVKDLVKSGQSSHSMQDLNKLEVVKNTLDKIVSKAKHIKSNMDKDVDISDAVLIKMLVLKTLDQINSTRPPSYEDLLTEEIVDTKDVETLAKLNDANKSVHLADLPPPKRSQKICSPQTCGFCQKQFIDLESHMQSVHVWKCSGPACIGKKQSYPLMDSLLNHLKRSASCNALYKKYENHICYWSKIAFIPDLLPNHFDLTTK